MMRIALIVWTGAVVAITVFEAANAGKRLTWNEVVAVTVLSTQRRRKLENVNLADRAAYARRRQMDTPQQVVIVGGAGFGGPNRSPCLKTDAGPGDADRPESFHLTVEGVTTSEKGRLIVSYRLWGCLLLTVGVVGQTPVYGQKIQEVQSESAASANGPIAEPKPALDLVRVEQLIFTGTNQFRTQEKRGPLKTNPQLAGAGQAFAEYLAHTDKFSHTADGKEPWDRTTKAGYQHCIILENIAYEYNSAGFTAEALADDFVHGWENSPGHRKNMLDPDVQDIGVGLARSSRTGRYYAVQDFGRPKSAMITFKVFNRTDIPVTYTIDGQTCTASPDYTITYERSRPPELRFPWGDKVNVTEAARKVFRPASGASYTIRTTKGDAVTVDSQ